MGGAVSAGESNDELIDNLMEADYIKSASIEQVFRAVDRADYYLKGHKGNAYKDLAWKHNNIHMSAPCIYAEVLESLQLEAGMSFLNLGSGTGYLSTLAGLIIGPYGMNHGIEMHVDVIQYARKRLEQFRHYNKHFDEFEFCEPEFLHGNCLLLSSGGRLYDRVYCGAACPTEHENYMKNLIKVGGILVMPLDDQLLQVRRTSQTEWETKSVLPVSFAHLVVPGKNGENDILELSEPQLLSLQEICRITVRRILRAAIRAAHPELKRVPKPRPPRQDDREESHPRRSCRGRRRVNIMPMSMGMMIMGQLDREEADDDEDQEDEEEEHEDDMVQERRQQHHSDDDEEEDEGPRRRMMGRGIPEILRHVAAMQRRKMRRVQRLMRQQEDDGDNEEEIEDDDEDDQGFEDAADHLGDSDAGESTSKVKTTLPGIFEPSEDDSSPPTSSTQEQEAQGGATEAIPIKGDRKRYSSNASSGLGTYSSVDDHMGEISREISRELSHEEPVLEEVEPLRSTANGLEDNCNNKKGSTSEDLSCDSDSSDKDIDKPSSSKDEKITTNNAGNGVAGNGSKSHVVDPAIVNGHEDIMFVPLQNHQDDDIVVGGAVMSDESEDEEIMDSEDVDMNDSVEENMEQSDDDETVKPSVMSSGFSLHMKERVEFLPVPSAIKQYLLFYRT